MKILVIMGSPRKGETYKVVRKAEETIQDAHRSAGGEGEVEFDYLWLKDMNFGMCRGCHACIRFGESKCPLKDDQAQVEQRMFAADGWILATPVYSQQVSYLMKMLFDRFSYAWHRPRFFGKFVMGIASGGGQFKETLGYIKQNTTRWGGTYASEIGAPHIDALQPKHQAKLEKTIQAASTRFYTAIREQRIPAPSLFDLIWFRMWRINAKACQEFIPADFQYWTEKGWFESEYYTHRPVGWPARLFARGMERLLRRVLRSVYVGY